MEQKEREVSKSLSVWAQAFQHGLKTALPHSKLSAKAAMKQEKVRSRNSSAVNTIAANKPETVSKKLNRSRASSAAIPAVTPEKEKEESKSGGLFSLFRKGDKKELKQDYNPVEATIVFFPPDGGGTDGEGQKANTPAHSLQTRFDMHVFEPLEFNGIRKQKNGKTAEFIKSLTSPGMTEFVTNSASGALFAITADRMHILKSAEKKEVLFLRSILSQYRTYLQNNPSSFIVRIVGAFKITLYTKKGKVDKKSYFIVMNNVDTSGAVATKAFDLKGSEFNRKASKDDFVGLDKNFKRVLSCAHKEYATLLTQFTSDIQFLVSQNIMDYSLFMSIHCFQGINYYQGDGCRPPPPLPKDKVYSKWTKALQKTGGYSAVGTPEVFFLGIIDILQTYDTKRKIQTTLQSKITRQEISVVKPDYYGQRFLDMIKKDITGSEDAKDGKCTIC